MEAVGSSFMTAKKLDVPACFYNAFALYNSWAFCLLFLLQSVNYYGCDVTTWMCSRLWFSVYTLMTNNRS